jgi:hypothetical protein
MLGKITSRFYQDILIADAYTDPKFGSKNLDESKKVYKM